MARGWESKAIEAQQDEKARAAALPRRFSPEEAQRQDRRRTLEMTRARVLHDLERATLEAHRKMLDQALAAVNDQLAELDRST
jgi:hypothetical protein